MKDELFGEALLVLTQDDEPQRNWSLARKVTTIGRWDDNEVVIPDRWVSRHHAEIHHQGTRYVIHDLDSKNGLYVNGTRISGSIALEDGDHIQIAPHCQLTFVDSEATAPIFQRQRGVLIDEDTCQVWIQEKVLEPPLSNAQFALLRALADHPGRVFSRDELIPLVWLDEDPSGITDEAVNSLARRLRKRLMGIDPSQRYIYAVRGHGFKFQQSYPGSHPPDQQ